MILDLIQFVKTHSDAINGLYEFGGAIFGLANLNALRKHKEVKGVHWSSFAYFMSWGVWNLAFYPINGLMFSFYGGAALVWVNMMWLAGVGILAAFPEPDLDFSFEAINLDFTATCTRANFHVGPCNGLPGRTCAVWSDDLHRAVPRYVHDDLTRMGLMP